MIYPKTAALLKKHYEGKHKTFNWINTIASIKSQVASINTHNTQGLILSPDLIIAPQEQIALQNLLPSANPSMFSPTASPQLRVNSAMEGMIGVPFQAAFHSSISEEYARRASHRALIS